MPNARQLISMRFADRIDGQDEFRLTDLVNAITAEVRGDPELMATVVDELLRPMVHSIGMQLLMQWRKQRLSVGDEVVGSKEYAATRSFLERRGRIKRLNWLVHYENAEGRHVRLTQMTRADLLNAISSRQKRVEAEQHWIRMFAVLVELMRDGEVVGDRFTNDDLDRIYTEAGQSLTSPD